MHKGAFQVGVDMAASTHKSQTPTLEAPHQRDAVEGEEDVARGDHLQLRRERARQRQRRHALGVVEPELPQRADLFPPAA